LNPSPPADNMLVQPNDPNLPVHIAVIMDGNGRWAKNRNYNRIEGHRKGIDAVRETVKECRRLGIRFITLYAFSIENWNRPAEEVAALMGILKDYIGKELPDLIKNGIKLRVIGNTDMISPDIMQEISIAIEKTRDLKDMELIIALSYSSRDEILRAISKLTEDVLKGALDPQKLSESAFNSYLDTKGIPDPDLLIRTSGEMRISNFLLWQMAYTEIYVTKKLWPDFSKEELHIAIQDYIGRERRFGLTGDQIKDNNGSNKIT